MPSLNPDKCPSCGWMNIVKMAVGWKCVHCGRRWSIAVEPVTVNTPQSRQDSITGPSAPMDKVVPITFVATPYKSNDNLNIRKLAVIDKAREYILTIWEITSGIKYVNVADLPEDGRVLLELRDAVCDLEGWNKDGERP